MFTEDITIIECGPTCPARQVHYDSLFNEASNKKL